MKKVASVIQVYVHEKHVDIINQKMEEGGHTNYSRTICGIIVMVDNLQKSNDAYQKELYREIEKSKTLGIKLELKVDECAELRDNNTKLEIDLQVLRGQK